MKRKTVIIVACILWALSGIYGIYYDWHVHNGFSVRLRDATMIVLVGTTLGPLSYLFAIENVVLFE